MTAERGVYFDQKTLERAEALKQTGLTWGQVAERLGCNPDSLRTIISQWRKGQWRPTTRPTEHEQFESLIREGFTVSDIAKFLRVSASAVSQRLARLGLDEEARKYLRAEAARARNRANTETRPV